MSCYECYVLPSYEDYTESAAEITDPDVAAIGLSESKFHSYNCKICGGKDYPGVCTGAHDRSDNMLPSFGIGISTYFIAGIEAEIGYDF